MRHRKHLLTTLTAGAAAIVSIAALVANQCSAADEKQSPVRIGPDAARLRIARTRAVEFLRSSQGDDGSWTSPTAPGITALVTTSLVRSGVSPEDPMIAKSLAHLKRFVQKDGGIYYSRTSHRNYETSICMLAFQAANRQGRYDKMLAAAAKFLRGLQWDEDEGLARSDDAYGGAGYGKHERPDLSNTQFFVEALKATGAQSDDPDIQKALLFVSRCQNLESAHNTTKFAAKINDGGFYYTIAAGGSSQAGVEPNGGLRSYGSMTYAGLKSMIYAGVGPDDPRVQATFRWIQRHYSVQKNPGLGKQGLYYYYHTFAKALAALDLETVKDAEGVRHDWRNELGQHLLSLQKDNGSWVNRVPRWYEGDPNLVTAYSLLALSYCDTKPLAKKGK